MLTLVSGVIALFAVAWGQSPACNTVASLVAQTSQLSTLNAAVQVITSAIDPWEMLGLVKEADPSVQAAGLATTLSDPSFKGTVFAPTDSAFQNALTRLGMTAQQLLSNTALLTQILDNHVTPQVITSQSLPLARAITIPTLLQGSNLEASKQAWVEGSCHYPSDGPPLHPWDRRSAVRLPGTSAWTVPWSCRPMCRPAPPRSLLSMRSSSPPL